MKKQFRINFKTLALPEELRIDEVVHNFPFRLKKVMLKNFIFSLAQSLPFQTTKHSSIENENRQLKKKSQQLTDHQHRLG